MRVYISYMYVVGYQLPPKYLEGAWMRRGAGTRNEGCVLPWLGLLSRGCSHYVSTNPTVEVALYVLNIFRPVELLE